MSVDHKCQNRRDWLTIVSWWTFAAWLGAFVFTVFGWYAFTGVNDLDFNLAVCSPAAIALMVRWELAIAGVLVVGPIIVACLALAARRDYMATVFFALAMLVAMPAGVIVRDALGLPSAAVPGEYETGRCPSAGDAGTDP